MFWQNTPLRERRWLIRWTLFRLEYVSWVFCCLEGGIYVRLDEHRAMSEFLTERYPAMLDRYPCIRRWLARQEIFLCQLEKSLPVGEFGNLPIRFRPGGYTYESVEFPRLPQRGSTTSKEGGPA